MLESGTEGQGVLLEKMGCLLHPCRSSAMLLLVRDVRFIEASRSDFAIGYLEFTHLVTCAIVFNRQGFMRKNTRLNTIDAPKSPRASGYSLYQLFLQRPLRLEFVDKAFTYTRELNWILAVNGNLLGQ